MISVSDPLWAAQQVFDRTRESDALYPQLPLPVRTRIEVAGVPGAEVTPMPLLLDVLKEYAPEEVTALVPTPPARRSASTGWGRSGSGWGRRRPSS